MAGTASKANVGQRGVKAPGRKKARAGVAGRAAKCGTLKASSTVAGFRRLADVDRDDERTGFDWRD